MYNTMKYLSREIQTDWNIVAFKYIQNYLSQSSTTIFLHFYSYLHMSYVWWYLLCYLIQISKLQIEQINHPNITPSHNGIIYPITYL